MNKLLLFIVLALMLIYPVAATISGSETMTRTVPSTVTKGVAFTVTYNIIGASGLFGVSVVDTVSGGCTPVGEHKFVIADDYQFVQSQSFTYTAPNADANCVFHGDYKFGSFAVKPLDDTTVIIGTAPCPTGQVLCNGVCATSCGECTSGQTQQCTVDTCAGTKTCAAGAWGTCVKTDSSCGVETCTDPNGCDGFCQYMTWAKFASETDYCMYGIGMIIGGIVLLILFMKK